MAPVKILVLRFSAMGDVALLVPVIRSVVNAQPHIEITVVTRPRFAAFFDDIDRVKVFSADVDHAYRGLFGMPKLFRALMRTASYDLVIDMHDHLRTMILRSLFRLTSAKVIVFEKGRKQKKEYARKENKIIRRLPHTVERYRAAFVSAGLPFDILPPPHFVVNEATALAARNWLAARQLEKKEIWVGLAPFAMHATKIWPLENYAQLIESILRKSPAKFFFFGGGEKEIRFFRALVEQYPDSGVVVAGELKIRHEIALMKQLDIMVCVDSVNMHLAALAGVPLLSIWGGTHPDLGFAPFGDNGTVVQISREELPCRPCSVYGRATCHIGGFPCLTRITPALIAETVLRIVKRPI